ncbi:cytochrome b/b6 domain-containing protein [Nostoc sp. FACHB-152]|uniref:cytochrome b/b6 domain-containing protein n=1 Tax=unclassified Nostoc TaxID=2593658 RepID=UPI001684E2A1|nr:MULTISPECIES: cytochrome b/b6 domain-containing protein [unclassified Nostoc]MBD2450785.1 cytochrome b/b6 domain-containing protein [Nostoc sp. FACHB-152]MBD2470242.1 cytochrome b/b6 domain-containing protein [Nostoc sp. FACHB-145]
MPRSVPYQPLLLRMLHGVSGILAIAAIITGFLVYNTYDGRFGKIPFPQQGDIQGIHGTFALFFLIVLPAFALYSFHAGNKRLIQKNSWEQISQVGQPIWWVSLQRLANTLMLIASVFSVISGRMMKEEWLPAGEIHHIWYSLHITAWAVIVCCLAIHILMSTKVGGAPLLLSMFSWQVRPEDSPSNWVNRYRTWWSSLPTNFGERANQLLDNNLSLRIIEAFVFIGVIVAFLLPLFFSE